MRIQLLRMLMRYPYRISILICTLCVYLYKSSYGTRMRYLNNFITEFKSSIHSYQLADVHMAFAHAHAISPDDNLTDSLYIIIIAPLASSVSCRGSFAVRESIPVY